MVDIVCTCDDISCAAGQTMKITACRLNSDNEIRNTAVSYSECQRRRKCFSRELADDQGNFLLFLFERNITQPQDMVVNGGIYRTPTTTFPLHEFKTVSKLCSGFGFKYTATQISTGVTPYPSFEPRPCKLYFFLFLNAISYTACLISFQLSK